MYFVSDQQYNARAYEHAGMLVDNMAVFDNYIVIFLFGPFNPFVKYHYSSVKTLTNENKWVTMVFIEHSFIPLWT